ncbi:MAG: hypothetical protein H7Y17_12975 [Chlorobia bacterium]|nr:hypothetical protein [Fimbriimonadaceae bacterium]
MIRIVGVQRNDSPDEEFVLFQNQGTLRETLRGHVVLSELALECADNFDLAHVFREDEQVPCGMYVILYTGHGKPRWARTKDNALIFFAYMGRDEAIWAKCPGPLHLLMKQHSYTNRAANQLMAS